MMRVKIGNTWFLSGPAPRDLAGYRTVLQADWLNLRMNFQKLSFWSCKTGTWDTPLPPTINLEQIICITAPTPMGRQNVSARDAAVRRLLGSMRLDSKSLDKVLNDAFPTVSFDVPVNAIRGLQSEVSSYLVGYYRMDDHILLVPEGKNPTGDFMILSLPYAVTFYAFETDSCPSREIPDSRFENELFLYDKSDGLLGSPVVRKRYFTDRYSPKSGSLWEKILYDRFTLPSDAPKDKDDYSDYFDRFAPPERRALVKKYHGK